MFHVVYMFCWKIFCFDKYVVSFALDAEKHTSTTMRVVPVNVSFSKLEFE